LGFSGVIDCPGEDRDAGSLGHANKRWLDEAMLNGKDATTSLAKAKPELKGQCPLANATASRADTRHMLDGMTARQATMDLGNHGRQAAQGGRLLRSNKDAIRIGPTGECLSKGRHGSWIFQVEDEQGSGAKPLEDGLKLKQGRPVLAQLGERGGSNWPGTAGGVDECAIVPEHECAVGSAPHVDFERMGTVSQRTAAGRQGVFFIGANGTTTVGDEQRRACHDVTPVASAADRTGMP